MMVRTLFPLAIFAGATLVAASPALADVKAGVDAWSRGDYAAAVREWRGPAERGDPDAQFNLGQAYKLGRGVQPDLAKAEELFGKAAARGHLQASDNYGLLLFQRGEHARAMPFINAAAGRGDPRAQYLLGLAHFNGDNVAKDWVRAYALVSLAQQAGLPQAAPALAQMDQYIPIEQRQQSVALASQLAGEAEATRARQVAASDLASGTPRTGPGPAASMSAPEGALPTAIPRMPSIASAEQALSNASRVAGNDSPGSAGADFTRPKAPVVTSAPRTAAPLPPPAPAKPTPAPVVARPAPRPVAPPPAPTPAPASSGDWRIQLGAFGVAGNADALWNKIKGRPELSGHGKVLEPAGRLTKLQAGGFATRADAQSACSRLSAGGFDCLPVRK